MLLCFFTLWSVGAIAKRYTLPLLVPATTPDAPQGVLRVLNGTDESGTVEIYAIDDAGTRSGPAIFTLNASTAVEFTATDLLSGNAMLGLTGGIGTDVGDARLQIETDLQIVPSAYVRAPDGTLSAMHDAVRSASLDVTGQYRYEVPVFNLSTEMIHVSRLRLINAGDEAATVTIGGRDDNGAAATGGDVALTLAPGGARTLTAQQLEAGDMGLTGRLGAGTAKWRLTVMSDRPLQVLNIVAATTGYWNNLSTTAEPGPAPADLGMFNERFVGQALVTRTRDAVATLVAATGERFIETLESGGISTTHTGSYGYAGIGSGAGRLTLTYDDGVQCAANQYFATRTLGWFASHCTGSDYPAEGTWMGGSWSIENEEEDRGGQGTETAFGVGAPLPGVPTSGEFVPSGTGGGSRVTATADGTTIALDDGAYFELNDGTRYTCRAMVGCTIVNGTVTSGAVTGRAPWTGDVDRFPSFRGVNGPGNPSYTVGTAIDALTLPEATGGNGTLSYSLDPGVPGLTFDATSRQLTGTPSTVGAHAMTYTVTDEDGDTDTLGFTVRVNAVTVVSGSLGGCEVGLTVGIGQSCTYPGTTDAFSVNEWGRGSFLGRLAGIRIRIDNQTINGRAYDFEASQQGDGVWRIDRVAGSTVAPSAADRDGDGIPDVEDPDDDNDGTLDLDDPCPLDGSDTCGDASGIASLQVSGARPMTSIGETIQLSATVHLEDGSTQGIASAFAHWAPSDPAVATVVDGTVTAVGGGNARIVATYQGRKAVVEVSVRISVHETATVRVIYAAPADREFRSDYSDAIQHAIVDVQSWYRRQLGGLTFSIYDTTPEQCQLSEAAEYYDQDTWPRVLEGLQHCAPVSGYTSTHVWVVYADLESVCGQREPLGRGGEGLTMLPRADLEGLIGNLLVYYGECGGGPWTGPVTRWIGGLAHELGHALSLAHPPGCDAGLPTCDFDALMHDGYARYPDTYLRTDDKQALWRSPFIDKHPAQRLLIEDAGIETAIRGTVTDSDGNAVQGIRIAAAGDVFWAWGETAPDGAYEIRLSDGSSGSAVLSAHAGDVAGCGWLGYHVAGGLTTIREHATTIEVGAVEPTGADITLPDTAGELCLGQRTISGVVRDPDGHPAAVWTGAFEQWSFTGEGGLFEIRLPENGEGLVSASPLFIEAIECGLVGFYGPGGFTTRPADAWRVEHGGVDVAGMEIRLPATPQELCDRQPVIAGTVFGPDGAAVEGIAVEAQPFSGWGTSGADGAFAIRLLEGSAGTAVLAIYADCGVVGYYGPEGFATSRADASGIDVAQGSLTGIGIRLPAAVNELCSQ